MQQWVGIIQDTDALSVLAITVAREGVRARDWHRIRNAHEGADVAEPANSYSEALHHVMAFKHYIENQDGYRLINKGEGYFANERDVQTYFGLAWIGTTSDVNREPNNGRGPVDFKVSRGATDKTLIEFKLGSNRQLRRNLMKQVEIYEVANQTKRSIKVIVCYTAKEDERVRAILSDLQQADAENVVLIDARGDNKPSASKA
ncbi:hypothetical protein Rhe02_60890 [Rhizocola hellebori]|uniref:Uncharacterized protein n=1 Tax=Rhizocola hellebori TaxID=1392758 RepID=A0A8J3VJ32_9ACTN|nr:hypothetical protein [Rhizocola hellebori]GIH08022.1 hypothetical protein Rhe02_60890 [Rhizocola hellebori]